VHHWICGIADHAQPLATVPERAQLLANGEARAAGRAIDPVPVVRLFTPDAHVTWLLAALDPADGDTAWGLIDLGIGMPAQGTVKLSELAASSGRASSPCCATAISAPHARCRNTPGWPSATARSRTEYGRL
jgi:hypothetical protein